MSDQTVKDLLADWLQDWAGRPRPPYRSAQMLLGYLAEHGYVVTRLEYQP